MIFISFLVHQLVGDVTSEWPLELVVKLSTHQSKEHTQVCTFAITKTFRTYIQTHLVAMRVGVEWWRVSTFIIILVSFKVGHGDLHWSNWVSSVRHNPLCFFKLLYLFLLFTYLLFKVLFLSFNRY